MSTGILGTEDVLAFLDEVAHLVALKSTEAQQSRRVVLCHDGAGSVPVAVRSRGPLNQDLYHHLELLSVADRTDPTAVVDNCSLARSLTLSARGVGAAPKMRAVIGDRAPG